MVVAKTVCFFNARGTETSLPRPLASLFDARASERKLFLVMARLSERVSSHGVDATGSGIGRVLRRQQAVANFAGA